METGKYFAFPKLPLEIHTLGYFPEEKVPSLYFFSLKKINLMEMFFILDFYGFSAFKVKAEIAGGQVRYLFHPFKLGFLKY